MHGYAGAQEKKAFKIAEKLRYNYWLESLAALSADESARLRPGSSGYAFSSAACFRAAPRLRPPRRPCRMDMYFEWEAHL